MKYLLYFPLLFLFGNNFSPGQKGTKKAFIEFRSTTLSFDTVKAGTIVKGEFNFKNTGDEMLGITTVQTSDGGTIAYWPQEVIKPGAGGIIKVEFGFTGSRQGFQDKLFNVISNADNSPVMLHWKGVIIGNMQ